MNKNYDLPFFPFYPNDILGDTISLNATKFGIYTKLLAVSWMEPLLDNIDDLMGTCRGSEQDTMFILNKYFHLVDNTWTNNRLEEERVKADIAHTAAVNRGRKGGQAKQSNRQSSSSTKDSLVVEGVATHNSELIPKKTELTSQKNSRFAPPTQEDVKKYMIDPKVKNHLGHTGAGQESEKFIDFYQSKGWFVGKTKMKDWKAAVRNWLRRVDPKNIVAPIDQKEKPHQCSLCPTKFFAPMEEYLKHGGMCEECRKNNEVTSGS